ncbi:acetamidase/formamidase family protein [Halorussus salinisoli]|uniref:acetamidase/formamidase family protein n=1 Tax=Halorussus salinisoli TaxID=2558242 RepID=UPI0010C22FF2|nr:acetamidase/formamidase family protein [Halorussus salinisoli]
MTNDLTADHRLTASDDNVHTTWDNAHDPVLSVSSGNIIEFECRDATNGLLDEDSTVDDIRTLAETNTGHPLTGPVEINDAQPGDTLAVDLLDFNHEGIGFSYFYPGEEEWGLLPEEFPEPGLHIWDLEGDIGHFVEGIEIPLHPFSGNLGVAPAEDGAHSTTPPRRVGGNLDVKHLTAGATLYLPIEVEGGLFSIGDCHAAQGDGEVCVTGVEAPMTVTARLRLEPDRDVDQPEFETTGPFSAFGPNNPAYGTTGISDDLMDATKKATRHMIDHLHEQHGLTRTDAYLLCSAIVDLKINEVVDRPNWVVSAYLPEQIFPD